MAIDSEQKRASSFIDACGIKIPPSGAISGVGDREWLVGEYSGLGAAVLNPAFPAQAIASPLNWKQSTIAPIFAKQSTVSASGPKQSTVTKRTS